MAKAKFFLPTATEETIKQWCKFLQEDAKNNGGTASTCLHRIGSGIVKITCCAQVVIVEHIADEFEAAMALAVWQREMLEGL